MSQRLWPFTRAILLAASLAASAALPAAAQGGPSIAITPGSTTYAAATTVNVQIDYCSAQPFNMSTHAITENGSNVTSTFTVTGSIPPGCVYGMRATGTVDLSSRNGNPVQKTISATVEDIYSYMGGGQATFTYNPPGFVREQHAVWVTPVPAARQSMPSTGSSTSFTIYNAGTRAGTYNLSAVCSAGVSSCSVSPSSVSLDTLSAMSQTVSVSYWAGSTQGDTGSIRLTATHNAQPAAWDSASTYVKIATVSPAPSVGVAVVSDGNVRNRALCLTAAAGSDGAYECGDLRLAHAMPAVRTRNQVRQLTLLYNSAHARPYPTVSADVTLDPSRGVPQQVVARLWHGGVAVATGSWTSGWATGATRRITLGFDATSWPTEIYYPQLEVAYLWSDNSWTSTWVNVAVPVVNRTYSPFGGGWWPAGIEQLVARGSGGYFRVGGDGSTAMYTRIGSTNVWQATGYAGPDTLYQDGSGNMRRRLPGGAEVVFNSSGQHVQTVPLAGPATVYSYDGSGRLSGIQLPSGSTAAGYSVAYGSTTTTFTIAAGSSTRSTTVNILNGRVQHITDPDGQYVQFGYGLGAYEGRIAYRIDRRNAVTYYAYDAAHKFVQHSLTLEDNSVIAGDFAPAESRGFSGSVVQHPDSAFTLINGPRTDVVDETRIWLNGHGAPVRTRDAEGWETVVTYDATFPALPKEVYRPTGAVSKAWYNSRGLVDSSAVLNMRYPGDPAAVTRVTWHPTLALPTMTQAPTGEAVYRDYNTNGTLAWVQPGPSSNRRTNFYYGGTGTSAGLYTSSYVPGTVRDSVLYDAGLANVSWARNRLLHPTTFGQDVFGRVIATWGAYASGKTRYDSTFYDVMGRDTLAVSRAMPNTYAGTFVTTGNVTMPDLALKVRQVYDAEGRLVDITRWSVPDSAEMNVMQNTYTYDRAGRKTAEHRAGGGGTGNMPLAAGSQFFTYNPAGNLIQHQDGAVIRTMAYDALGRLTHRTIPDQTYAVSHCSNLDPLGLNGACYYSFPLSTGGTAALKVDGDTELFAYDRAGNVTRADNQHARISRRYSPGGLLLTDTLRIRKVRYATTGSVVPAQDFTNVYGIGYTYDASGRRASLSFPDQLDPCWGPCAAQQYTYDSNTGALSQITDLRGQYFSFSYTNAGQLQSLTYPGNVAEQILSFDDEGSPLVRHVTRSGVPWIADTLAYDPAGRPISVRGRNLTSGVPQTTYNAYDGLGSLAMTEFYNGGTPRLEQYWADALGTNYKTARHNIKLAQSEQNPIVKFPRYTGDGRIARDSMYTNALYVSHDNTDYFYDAQGRTRYTYSRTFDYQNNINDYHQSASYYDGNGRLAQFERHVGDMQQASLGQDPRAVVETYRYDALGRRILTHSLRSAGGCTVAGCESTVQRFIWDGDQMLYEVRVRGDSAYFGYLDDDQGSGTGIYNAPNAYGRVGYTHAGGIDRPIGAVRGTTPFYPHTNWRGLYESATVDNGTVLTNDVNYPGASASAYLGWTPPSTPYEWFGSLVTEQADASGLLYRRNRYYDPKAGRFTQPDPIGIAGGLNSYGYAGGDPVSYSDPFGLCPPIEECLKEAGDIGVGLTPGLSTIADGATLLTGRNFVTGENVGLGGRVIAAIGLFTPVSGGGIRGAAKGVDFLVTAKGTAIRVPDAAVGPTATKASGYQFTGGTGGGKGLDSRVTGVRIMDANKQQGRRAVYMNKKGQGVSPSTGRTLSPDHPDYHHPIP